MRKKFLTVAELDTTLPDQSTIIDLGCGGRKLELPSHQVIGLDHRKGPGVDYACNLAEERLPFDSNSVDLVYSNHFVEHLTYSERVRVFFEVQRVLKVGGLFVFNVPHFTSFYITAFDHKGINFGHATVWALEHALTYSLDIPHFKATSIGLRARIGKASVIDSLLNMSFRFSERYLHIVCGGIDEIQFCLEKP